MEHQTVPASKPGQPPVRIDKRTLDSKFFLVDLSPLLANKEEVYGAAIAHVPPGNLVVDSSVAKNKKFLLVKLSGGPVNIPYEDYATQFQVKTTSGSTIAVPVLIRVYSI